MAGRGADEDDGEEDQEAEALKVGAARLFPAEVLWEESVSRRAGASREEERAFRSSYCEFIREVGMKLKM